MKILLIILLIWIVGIIYYLILNFKYNRPIQIGEIWILNDLNKYSTPAKFKIRYVDNDLVVVANLFNNKDKYRFYKTTFLRLFKKTI